MQAYSTRALLNSQPKITLTLDDSLAASDLKAELHSFLQEKETALLNLKDALEASWHLPNLPPNTVQPCRQAESIQAGNTPLPPEDQYFINCDLKQPAHSPTPTSSFTSLSSHLLPVFISNNAETNHLWQYFAAANTGETAVYPFSNWAGAFEPRTRPWYSKTASGPQDIVVILDLSSTAAFIAATEYISDLALLLSSDSYINVSTSQRRARN